MLIWYTALRAWHWCQKKTVKKLMTSKFFLYWIQKIEIICSVYYCLFPFVYFSFWFYRCPRNYFYFRLIFIIRKIPLEDRQISNTKYLNIKKSASISNVFWFVLVKQLNFSQLIYRPSTKILIWFCNLWSSMRCVASFFKQYVLHHIILCTKKLFSKTSMGF